MNVLFWMSTGFNTTSRHLLISILSQLCDAGHMVTVIHKITPNDENEVPEELKQYSIIYHPCRVRGIHKGNLISRYLTDIKYVKSCEKLIDKNFDAVFIQSSNVAGLCMKAVKKKVPKAIVTLNVQDIFPYNAMFSGTIKRKGTVFRCTSFTQRYAYRKADHIITISPDMKNLLVADGVSNEKIQVVYNWSYQDELYTISEKEYTLVNHIFNREYFNVVYAGNIGRMQNVDIIIQAANLLKSEEKIRFHIIGNGVYKSHLEKEVHKTGINNVTFWPMQNAQLAPIIYSAADINIIPLINNIYQTALPSKTATCLACNKPIIFAIGKQSKFGRAVEEATRCPVIDSDDAEALVKAILAIKNNVIHCDTARFYLANCKKTTNSKKYVDIITGQ